MHDFCIPFCGTEAQSWRLEVHTLMHTDNFACVGMYKYLHVLVIIHITFDIIRNQDLNPIYIILEKYPYTWVGIVEDLWKKIVKGKTFRMGSLEIGNSASQFLQCLYVYSALMKVEFENQVFKGSAQCK